MYIYISSSSCQVNWSVRYKLYQRIKSTERLRKRGLNTTNSVCENASVSRLLLLLLKKLFSTRLRSQDFSTLLICFEFSRYRSLPFAGFFTIASFLRFSFRFYHSFSSCKFYSVAFFLLQVINYSAKVINYSIQPENHFEEIDWLN